MIGSISVKSTILVLLLVVFICVTLPRSVHSQHVRLGICPSVIPMENFNIEKYAGKWYEVEKYWFVFEATTACLSVEYFYDANHTETFAVEIKQMDLLTRKWPVNPGNTRFVSKDGSGNLVLDLLITQSPLPFTVQYPYMVLGTDYETYTIKWACQNVGPLSVHTLWILSRERVFKPKARKTVYEILRSQGVATHLLRRSNQFACE